MKRSLNPYPGAIRVVTCKDGTVHTLRGYLCFTLSGLEAHMTRARLESDEKVFCGPHVVLLYGKPTEYFDEELNKYSEFEDSKR